MLTGIIGNGLALLVAGVAILAARFRHDLPGSRTHEILLTGAIVLMVFSGELARSTGLGSWLTSLIHGAESLVGSDAITVLALITLAVLVVVARHVFKTAGTSGLWLAFTLPFLLAVFQTGFFHELDTYLQVPAQDLATAISTHLGV